MFSLPLGAICWQFLKFWKIIDLKGCLVLSIDFYSPLAWTCHGFGGRVLFKVFLKFVIISFGLDFSSLVIFS